MHHKAVENRKPKPLNLQKSTLTLERGENAHGVRFGGLEKAAEIWASSSSRREANCWHAMNLRGSFCSNFRPLSPLLAASKQLPADLC